MKTLTYKTSVKLAKWLGKDATKPLDYSFWTKDKKPYVFFADIEGHIPAYQLHDILSRPFCEAFTKKTDLEPVWISKRLWGSYYFDGGMEAVEKEINRMMEGK